MASCCWLTSMSFGIALTLLVSGKLRRCQFFCLFVFPTIASFATIVSSAKTQLLKYVQMFSRKSTDRLRADTKKGSASRVRNNVRCEHFLPHLWDPRFRVSEQSVLYPTVIAGHQTPKGSLYFSKLLFLSHGFLCLGRT